MRTASVTSLLVDEVSGSSPDAGTLAGVAQLVEREKMPQLAQNTGRVTFYGRCEMRRLNGYFEWIEISLSTKSCRFNSCLPSTNQITRSATKDFQLRPDATGHGYFADIGSAQRSVVDFQFTGCPTSTECKVDIDFWRGPGLGESSG